MNNKDVNVSKRCHKNVKSYEGMAKTVKSTSTLDVLAKVTKHEQIQTTKWLRGHRSVEEEKPATLHKKNTNGSRCNTELLLVLQ